MKYFEFISRHIIQAVFIIIAAWVLSAASGAILWARAEIIFWISFLSLSLIYVLALKRKKWQCWLVLGATFSLLESALIIGFIGMIKAILMECAPPVWPASFFYFSLAATAAVFWYFHFVLSYALVKK